MAPERQPTSFRLTTEALRLLDELADYYGMSRTSVIEMLVRDKVRSDRADRIRQSYEALKLVKILKDPNAPTEDLPDSVKREIEEIAAEVSKKIREDADRAKDSDDDDFGKKET